MTKLLSLAALATAALAVTTTAALADNSFSLDRALSTASSLQLTNVQADQAGSFLVFERDGGHPNNLGAFLGEASVAAGATADLSVPLSQTAEGRMVVVMMNGNHSVAKMTTRQVLAD